jgi:hypothetical protein
MMRNTVVKQEHVRVAIRIGVGTVEDTLAITIGYGIRYVV